jgi:hypothetical protein
VRIDDTELAVGILFAPQRRHRPLKQRLRLLHHANTGLVQDEVQLQSRRLWSFVVSRKDHKEVLDLERRFRYLEVGPLDHHQIPAAQSPGFLLQTILSFLHLSVPIVH